MKLNLLNNICHSPASVFGLVFYNSIKKMFHHPHRVIPSEVHHSKKIYFKVQRKFVELCTIFILTLGSGYEVDTLVDNSSLCSKI